MILSAGEILWDVYPDGREVPGGAPLNFAFHCRQLGRAAAVVSQVGTDELGSRLRSQLQALGVSDEFVQTDDARPTGTVRVTLDAAGVPSYTITPDVAWDAITLSKELLETAEIAGAVYFGTLAMRSAVSRKTILDLADANSRSVLPSVRICDVNLRNPRPKPEVLASAVRMAEWVKATVDELPEVAAACGVAVEQLPAWHRVECAGPESVWIITDGANGATVTSRTESFRTPAAAANVDDTVGAGDGFLAALLCKRLDGLGWQQALEYAAWYAARVCEQPGATPRITV